MAPRSPSLSFEPTPAIDPDKENLPPRDEFNTDLPEQRFGRKPSIMNRVRFSDLTPASRRAQSVATPVPHLEPIPSASQLPCKDYYSKSSASVIDFEAYMEQSRLLLQEQRERAEAERKEGRDAFEKERKLWSAERELLKAKIRTLESLTNKTKDAKRRYSNDGPRSGVQSFRSNFAHDFTVSSLNGLNGSRTPLQNNQHIWQPGTSKPATRVFSNEEQTTKRSTHLHSICEDGFKPPLGPATSSSTLPKERTVSLPVPIEKIDDKLDGITLKSTALVPSFVPSLTSPQPMTPQRSLSPNAKTDAHIRLHVDLCGLPSPTEKKLVLHAGHTPMAFSTDGSTSPASELHSAVQTPTQERPFAPVPSARPRVRPSERSDSYFSMAIDEDVIGQETDEDPELKEPLVLSTRNEKSKSDGFFNQLDARLLLEAEKGVGPAEESSSQDRDHFKDADMLGDRDDEMPKLRLKKSTNFGSAFGSTRCGNI